MVDVGSAVLDWITLKLRPMTDRTTGELVTLVEHWTYRNPLGEAFPPILGTTALATCGAVPP